MVGTGGGGLKWYLTPHAEADLLQDAGYLFAHVGPGRALRFERAVSEAADRVLADPTSHPVHHVASHLRRCPVRDGFPHDLLFTLDGADVRIVAAWRPRREPATLARRT